MVQYVLHSVGENNKTITDIQQLVTLIQELHDIHIPFMQEQYTSCMHNHMHTDIYVTHVLQS